jgi:hypothetical protein
MATSKVEKAGICFRVGAPGGPVTIDVRPNHDTISALRGIQVSFELLNGITPAQAKKLVDVLNENLVGVVVTSSLGDQAKAAAASETATKL